MMTSQPVTPEIVGVGGDPVQLSCYWGRIDHGVIDRDAFCVSVREGRDNGLGMLRDALFLEEVAVGDDGHCGGRLRLRAPG